MFHKAPFTMTMLILTLLQHHINHLDEDPSCPTDLLRKHLAPILHLQHMYLCSIF